MTDHQETDKVQRFWNSELLRTVEYMKKMPQITEESIINKMKESLSNGADIHAVNGVVDNTVSNVAINHQYKKVIKFLLDSGAKFDIENSQGDVISVEEAISSGLLGESTEGTIEVNIDDDCSEPNLVTTKPLLTSTATIPTSCLSIAVSNCTLEPVSSDHPHDDEEIHCRPTRFDVSPTRRRVPVPLEVEKQTKEVTKAVDKHLKSETKVEIKCVKRDLSQKSKIDEEKPSKHSREMEAVKSKTSAPVKCPRKDLLHRLTTKLLPSKTVIKPTDETQTSSERTPSPNKSTDNFPPKGSLPANIPSSEPAHLPLKTIEKSPSTAPIKPARKHLPKEPCCISSNEM